MMHDRHSQSSDAQAGSDACRAAYCAPPGREEGRPQTHRLTQPVAGRFHMAEHRRAVGPAAGRIGRVVSWCRDGR